MYLLKSVTWVAFIGLAVKAGTQLVQLVLLLIVAEAPLPEYGWVPMMTGTVFQILKVVMLGLLLKGLMAVDLASPFTSGLVALLRRLWITIGLAGLVGVVHNATLAYLRVGPTQHEMDLAAGEYLFLGGLVYLVAVLFQRGVDIQQENQFTV